jgi:Ras-related protein Rab-6A
MSNNLACACGKPADIVCKCSSNLNYFCSNHLGPHLEDKSVNHILVSGQRNSKLTTIDHHLLEYQKHIEAHLSIISNLKYSIIDIIDLIFHAYHIQYPNILEEITEIRKSIGNLEVENSINADELIYKYDSRMLKGILGCYKDIKPIEIEEVLEELTVKLGLRPYSGIKETTAHEVLEAKITDQSDEIQSLKNRLSIETQLNSESVQEDRINELEEIISIKNNEIREIYERLNQEIKLKLKSESNVLGLIKNIKHLEETSANKDLEIEDLCVKLSEQIDINEESARRVQPRSDTCNISQSFISSPSFIKSTPGVYTHEEVARKSIKDNIISRYSQTREEKIKKSIRELSSRLRLEKDLISQKSEGAIQASEHLDKENLQLPPTKEPLLSVLKNPKIKQIAQNLALNSDRRFTIRKKTQYYPAKISLYKLLIVGESVGKSSIIYRYIYNTFNQDSYIEAIEIYMKDINVEGKMIEFHIFDPVSYQHFTHSISRYYDQSSAILIVYDVTNLHSFLSVDTWIKSETQTVGKQVLNILVANKIDEEEGRVVTTEQGQEKAKELNAIYMEVSALSGVNIDGLFYETAKLLINMDSSLKNPSIFVSRPSEKDSEKCCLL